MDFWELATTSYPNNSTIKSLTKAVNSAKVLIKEDLADFEIDFFLQTLFCDPVYLLRTLSDKRYEEGWSLVIGHSLEVINSIVDTLSGYLGEYLDELVKTCMLPYPAVNRRRALTCMISITKSSPSHVIAPICDLLCDGLVHGDDSMTVKAVRAELIGVICEYHPELMREKYLEIWRNYLNLLEASKTTDYLKNGILKGINGLFKHFGEELPTAELNNFYNKLSQKYLDVEACEKSCIELICVHIKLYPELASEDVRVRPVVWKHHNPEHLQMLYDCVINRVNVQSILVSEIIPKFNCKTAQERYAAYKLVANAIDKYTTLVGDIQHMFYRQATSLCTKLLFSLEQKIELQSTDEDREWEFDYDLLQLVHESTWCIISNLPESELLLKCVILVYHRIPTNQRKKYVAHTILKTKGSLRKNTLLFLINTGITNSTGYTSLWKQLFDTDNGTDETVLANSKPLFDDFMQYLLCVFKQFLDMDTCCIDENITSKLSSILTLLTVILTYDNTADYIQPYLNTILDAVLTVRKRGLVSTDSLLLCVSVLLKVGDEGCALENGGVCETVLEGLRGFLESLSPNTCRDESNLCATCILLMRAPSILIQDDQQVLESIYVIFCRNDVDSSVLSHSLGRLEDILNSNNSYDTLVAKIVNRISTLRVSKVSNDKATRVLQREVVIFLAKYGSLTQKNEENDFDNSLIMDLKDKITLDFPYLNSGIHFKLKLENILHLAIVEENAQALEKLLVIICANLSNKSEVQMQIALVSVIYRMCRCHCRGEHLSVPYLEHAVAMCSDVQCVFDIVEYITSETSPGVRKMLCDLLETLISKQELSRMDECIKSVHEQADLMMANQHSISKRAGLDLAETLSCILKKNNTLAKEFTPKLLVSISRTNEIYSLEIFRETTNLLSDKIVLFDHNVLEELFSKSIRILLEINDYYLYNNMSKNIAKVLKEISDNLGWEVDETFDKIWEVTKLSRNPENIPKLLYFYSDLKLAFDITRETQCNFISKNNFEIFNMLKKLIEGLKEASEINEFSMETIYFTFYVYSAALMEVKYQGTLECFAEVLKSVTPIFIKNNHKIIEKCFLTYKSIWKTFPLIVINSLEYWLSKYLRISEIASRIDQKMFTYEDSIKLNSTKKLLNIFDLEKFNAISTEINENFRKITGILLKLYATNYIEEYLNSQMSYLTDLMAVSLYFLTEKEIKSYMHEGIDLSGVSTEKLGLRFCAFFIEAWAPFLLNKDWFLTPELVKCSPLFHDVIKFYAARKCDKDICDKIFTTIDTLWPDYTTKFNLVQLCAILQDVSLLVLEPWSLASNPGQWWLQCMSSDINIDDKLKLMQVLKVFVRKGVENDFKDDYRNALTAFSSHLPSKVTELQSRVSPALLLVLLNSLSETLDREVLRVVCGIFVSDNTQGWWDTALANTIQHIAKCTDDVEFTKHVYAMCNRNDMYICLYERVLVPLLRYAPMDVCEEFYPLIMKDVLSNLNRKLRSESTTSATLSYFVMCTRGLMLAQSVFEKLPLNLLESPSSTLYRDIQLKYGKTLASELCKICVTLRMNARCGEEATDDVKRMYRKFQTSIWNCLSAILYKINAAMNIYKVLLKEDVWDRIVEKDVKYVIYIQAQGRSSLKRHSLPSSASPSQLSPLATFTSNPTMFLTMTFSDNPLQYDLLSNHNHNNQETQTYHLSLSDNSLNSHPCMTSLCVQLTRVSGIEDRQWIEWIRSSIEVNGGNVAWFLGQAIINCKEVLKPLRNELESSMIYILANTTYEHDGVKLLNGLHLHIIETLSYWYDPARDSNLDPNIANLNNTLQHLIHTYIHHKTREYVQKTILKCMSQFLVLYGKWVQVEWEDIEKGLKDPQTAPHILALLTLLSKHSVFIPQLLTTLPKWLSVSNRSVKLTDIAKLYAMTVKCCHEGSVKSESLCKFWAALDRIRAANTQEYIKVLFYAQNECLECCNEMQFRHTTNVTNQMIREQKSKCYSILSNFTERCSEMNEYISHMLENIDLFDAVVNAEHTAIALNLAKNGLKFMTDDMKRRVVFLTSEYCYSPVHKIRMQAVELMIRAFKEMLSSNTSTPSSKRRRLDYPSKLVSMLHTTDIYTKTVFTSVCLSVCDMEGTVLEQVKEVLSRDLDVRLAECLLLTLHRPSSTESEPNSAEHSRSVPSACLSRCLELFFNELVTNDGFKSLLLRNTPLDEASSATCASKLLTLSKSYQGTFRSQYRSGAVRKRNANAEQSTKIDVQIPLKDILQTFLEFSKQSPETSLVLIKEIIRNLPKESTQFGFNTYLAELLCTVLTDRVDELTPYIIELSRICLDDLAKEQSFKPTVDRLKVLTRMTEGQYAIDILHEDILLRSGGDEMFELGKMLSETVECEMINDPDEFNIEDMIKSFGLLSNWDNLTVQKKRQIQNVQLPKLWTSVDDFNEKITKFEAPCPPWLNRMRLSLSNTTSLAREHYKWMREVQQWPNNYFTMSAIIECIIWRQMLRDTDMLKLPSDIRDQDCMAEWACRFMIRSCYYQNQITSGCYPLDSSELCKQSHRNALVWAEKANCMGLSDLVLDCVKANVSELSTSSEMLPWLHQQSRAMRNIGLTNNSMDTLKKTLQKLENTTIDYREDTSPNVLLSIAALSMDLHNHLNSATQNKATEILEDAIEQKSVLVETKTYNQKCKEHFINTCKSIMCYYNQIDIKDISTYQQVLCQMNRCLTEIVQTNDHVLTELFIIFIVNKLDGYQGGLEEEFLKEFVNNLNTSIKYLKGHTLHELKAIIRYIPKSLLREHPKLYKVIHGDDNNTKYRMCLKLIRDPEYALGEYVKGLSEALGKNDGNKWNEIISSINTNILVKEYAGTSYRLLHKYSTSINSIGTFDSTTEFTTKAREVLKTIHQQLSLRSEVKSTLDLQDLCPALSNIELHTSEEDSDSLSELLGLEKEKVFRFDRKIEVYITSIRRACRFRVILTDGSCTRFIVKGGECLHLDAGSQAIQGVFNHVSGAHSTCYRVSPLSEDSAVIEYLEDHKPLREFIGQTYNLDQIMISRPDDRELIAMSANSTMNSYKSMCQKIPAYCLRTAIEANSVSFADFVNKKRNFEQSVAVSTVYHWILGVGDRHLENTLYSLKRGSLSSIDWGTVFQYRGCSVPELAPARLTRNVVAVCDVTVLEARMQQVLTSLRENVNLIMPFIKSIFKWINTFAPESIDNKLNYMENILKGSSLPHEITAQAIMDSDSIRYKEQYCKLLEEIFEDSEIKSSYNVEEQITHLLRQCTDPRILAITRRGLEPWI